MIQVGRTFTFPGAACISASKRWSTLPPIAAEHQTHLNPLFAVAKRSPPCPDTPTLGTAMQIDGADFFQTTSQLGSSFPHYSSVRPLPQPCIDFPLTLLQLIGRGLRGVESSSVCAVMLIAEKLKLISHQKSDWQTPPPPRRWGKAGFVSK